MRRERVDVMEWANRVSGMQIVAMPTGHDSTTAAFDRRIAFGLATVVLLMHVAANLISPYEFHRDEFLYVAMGTHLSLWQMDFPPFIAIVARLSRAIFGDSMAGLRLAPAISHAVMVAMSAWAAQAFGGRRSAQALAALAVAFSPLGLRPGTLFQPVTFDQLWWSCVFVALIVRVRDDDPKHWLGIGVFLGLGALTKFSVAFLAAGLLVALLVTPLRRDLRTRWPWMALAIAIAIGHPSIVGQMALGWPVRTQMQVLTATQLAHVGPFDFLSQQLLAGPIVVLALIGVIWLWRTPYRVIAIATLTSFVLLLLLRGKSYYIGPIYPVLAAAGAAALDRLGFKATPRRPTIPLAVAAAAVALFGIVALPFGLPILAPEPMAAYAAGGGPSVATTTNMGEKLVLPQDYADMLGWNAMVDTVARVWRSLPPDEQAQAAIVADNYGRAGALELLGRRRELPPVVSPVGSFWFFGPGTRAGTVTIVVGDDVHDLQRFFGEVTEVTRTSNPMGVPEEQSVPIHVCRKPFKSLQQIWPSLAGQN